MRADEHRVELDALRAEGVHHELVRAVEVGLRKARRAEAVLVGDHHQRDSRACASCVSAANTPGMNFTFASESTCRSAGSSMSVPSRSTNRTGEGRSFERLQQPIVLDRRPDADAQGARQPDLRPHFADQQIRGAPSFSARGPDRRTPRG